MDLRDWLKKNDVTQAEFGRRLSPPASQAKVSHWLQGARRVSLAEALSIVRATNGEVTIESLATLHRRGADASDDSRGLAPGDAPSEEPGQGSDKLAKMVG